MAVTPFSQGKTERLQQGQYGTAWPPRTKPGEVGNAGGHSYHGPHPHPARSLNEVEKGSRSPLEPQFRNRLLGAAFFLIKTKPQLPRVSQGYLARGRELPRRSDPFKPALRRLHAGRDSCPHSLGSASGLEQGGVGRGGARRLPGAGRHGWRGSPWATATHCLLAPSSSRAACCSLFPAAGFPPGR